MYFGDHFFVGFLAAGFLVAFLGDFAAGFLATFLAGVFLAAGFFAAFLALAGLCGFKGFVNLLLDLSEMYNKL